MNVKKTATTIVDAIEQMAKQNEQRANMIEHVEMILLHANMEGEKGSRK